MLENIPTYVLAGPLGAGKTSIARHWLQARPAGERWAVMINEFGDVGLDAALLQTGEEGIAIAEVAGGCVCCVNGAPFTVALSRLIRVARPQKVLIELSGLSHPQPLLRQLRAAPWAGVLALEPLIVVLDGLALQAGGCIPQPVLAAMAAPCTVVINKAETLDGDARARIEMEIQQPVQWISYGALDWASLPPRGLAPTAHPRQTGLQRLSPAMTRAVPEEWSVGWQAPPGQLIDKGEVEALLQRWPWIRAKLIIHTRSGWESANLVPNQPLAWRASEWRKDSRVELIFDASQNRDQLNQNWASCLLAP